MALTNLNRTPLAQGQTVTALDVSPTASGTSEVSLAITSDTILVSLNVESVSGTLDVEVFTSAGTDGAETSVITFPTLTSPTTELQLRKAATTMGYIRIVASYSDACTFTIKVRGIGTGDASVKILGQTSVKNYAVTVGSTANVLIASALTDRAGLALHNTDQTKTVYIGFTLGSTTTVDGWELGPGEKIGLDVASGVALFALTNVGTTVVKVLEAGS